MENAFVDQMSGSKTMPNDEIHSVWQIEVGFPMASQPIQTINKLKDDKCEAHIFI